MATLLQTKIIPGKQIIGYKLYKTTTTKYAGGSAGITGYKMISSKSDGTNIILFNYDGKVYSSGTYTRFLMNIYANAGQDISTIITLRVYNETTVNGVTKLINTQNVDIPITFVSTTDEQTYLLDYTLPTPLSLSAGQIIAIDIPGSNLFSFSVFGTYEYCPYYEYTSGGTNYQEINLSSIENYEYINNNNIYSFELIGEFNALTEITDGYVGYLSTATATIPITEAVTTIDLGSINQISILSFTDQNVYGTNMEILISKENTNTPSNSSWISVYYGVPQYYGNILSLGRGYIGFPFSCRHIKIITSGVPGGSCSVYKPTSTTYNGNYFPKSVTTGTDFILTDLYNSDTAPTWYMIVPVLSTLSYGTISSPISNRINI